MRWYIIQRYREKCIFPIVREKFSHRKGKIPLAKFWFSFLISVASTLHSSGEANNQFQEFILQLTFHQKNFNCRWLGCAHNAGHTTRTWRGRSCCGPAWRGRSCCGPAWRGHSCCGMLWDGGAQHGRIWYGCSLHLAVPIFGMVSLAVVCLARLSCFGNAWGWARPAWSYMLWELLLFAVACLAWPFCCGIHTIDIHSGCS
jgi:hypothetical protein